MQRRIMIIETDDPAEPGLLIRRYARVVTCWDPTVGGWAWFRQTAAGETIYPLQGPFEAVETAFEEAAEALGGIWETEEGERV
jgi:hypothetical protein